MKLSIITTANRPAPPAESPPHRQQWDLPSAPCCTLPCTDIRDIQCDNLREGPSHFQYPAQRFVHNMWNICQACTVVANDVKNLHWVGTAVANRTKENGEEPLSILWIGRKSGSYTHGAFPFASLGTCVFVATQHSDDRFTCIDNKFVAVHLEAHRTFQYFKRFILENVVVVRRVQSPSKASGTQFFPCVSSTMNFSLLAIIIVIWAASSS
jgi:hypothetical protein